MEQKNRNFCKENPLNVFAFVLFFILLVITTILLAFNKEIAAAITGGIGVWFLFASFAP